MPFQGEQELALAGMALARNWLGGNRATSEDALAEIHRLAGQPTAEWLDTPERSVGDGYRDWALTYDLPGNPIIALEEPVGCVNSVTADLQGKPARPCGTQFTPREIAIRRRNGSFETHDGNAELPEQAA